MLNQAGLGSSNFVQFNERLEFDEVIMKRFVWLIGVLLLAGCVTVPRSAPPEEEGVTVRLPYARAFERLVQLLESQGYNIAIADQRVGIIETLPKQVEGGERGIQHRVLLSFLLRGDRIETLIYTRVIVTSDYPAEREKILEAIKGLSP